MDDEINILVIRLFIAAGLAFIPAGIASRKGRSFGLWFLYGFLLWIVAFIHALAISKKEIDPTAAKGLDQKKEIQGAV